MRRVAPGDLPFFTRIHSVADVVRYIGHGRPRSAEETQAWLESTMTSYAEHDLGQLAVLRKADGMLLGRCGLSDLVIESRPASNTTPRAWFGRALAPADLAVTQERELGYTFDATFWGHGYATEAAQCVFAYARDVLKLSRVISVIDGSNARSQRVAQRCGLRRTGGRIDNSGRLLDVYIWPL